MNSIDTNVIALEAALTISRELGTLIRSHLTPQSRSELLAILLTGLESGPKHEQRICRIIEIGIAQGIADAHSEGTFNDGRDAGSSS